MILKIWYYVYSVFIEHTNLTKKNKNWRRRRPHPVVVNLSLYGVVQASMIISFALLFLFTILMLKFRLIIIIEPYVSSAPLSLFYVEGLYTDLFYRRRRSRYLFKKYDFEEKQSRSTSTCWMECSFW